MPDPNTNDGERNDAGDRRSGDSIRGVAPDVDRPPVVDGFALISAIPGIHILCAPDAPRFTVLAVSDEVLALSGHTRAHLLGRGYTEAFHSASSTNGASVAEAEPRTEALIAAVATRASQEIRQRRRDIVHPDGEREERYWRTVTTPVFAPDGSISALHIRAEDVTTKVLGDLPIARAAERADHIPQRISDAYIVLDRDFRFVAVNAAAERSMQKTREELLGRCHWEVFPASYDIPAGQGYRRAAQEGVPQHFTQHYRWEGYDVHLEMDAYPAGDGGVAVFWRDVTARVKAEQGLRASEERYALAASATNNAIWDWDLVTDRIAWSPGLSTVFGYDASLVETSGQWWIDAIHAEDRERVMAGLKSFIEDGVHENGDGNGGAWHDSYRLRRADGTWAHVMDRGNVMRDSAGRPKRLIGAMEDVSARMELEERLRQAQKMEAVGQLAGGVAHDFNNLLTIIGGALHFVRSGLPDDHAVIPDLYEIAEATDRATSLVRQLLMFSRKQVVHPRPVRLGEVVRGAEKLLRRVIGEEITLHVTVDDCDSQVLADPGQLEQVLLNLAVNARDALLTPLHGHNGRGGTLAIAVNEIDVVASDHEWDVLLPGRYVQLTVRDSGHGMDAETKARAFEPFFTTKGVGAGTGLGLASVFGIVQQSSGAIRVESAPGDGTTFCIRFPVARSVHAPLVPSNTPPRDAVPGTTILLVEDEAPLRTMLRRMLERAGYAVADGANGADALRLWRAHSATISAVVTDVRMPQIGGRELVAALREERPDLPVLFLSGYWDQAPKLPLGPNESFVEKPFTAEHVLHALDALVRSAGRRE